MYDSPIDVIYKDAEMEFEKDVVTAVQSYGINVDKDELIKALQYDRGQYEKGYQDAKREHYKTGHWIITNTFDDCQYVYCDNCNTTQVLYHGKPLPNFCPECGADMRNTLALKLKTCGTCKHFPPSKKWPCEDCDMREPADRWEGDK